jgi:hypothetical protein
VGAPRALLLQALQAPAGRVRRRRAAPRAHRQLVIDGPGAGRGHRREPRAARPACRGSGVAAGAAAGA